MKDNGVVCMLPWVHTTVSMKNILRPCCRFSLGKDDDETKPIPYMVKIAIVFSDWINGKYACRRCQVGMTLPLC